MRRKSKPKADINITPLIDVLLVLLVIFMVITPIAPKGMSATLPQEPASDQDETSNRTIVLSMNKYGLVRINQDEVETAAVFARLQDIFKTRSDRTIFIQADPDLLFNDVARLIDLAKGAGASNVGLLSHKIGN